MITQDTIQNLANKYQTSELNVRREYVQHLFLSYFYQQEETSEIYFKGGTALRIVYNSPRFSEDLDFSASFYDITHIENAILNALKEIEREGIVAEIKESKKTTGGYLGILHFILNEETILIQIEISKREGERSGEVATINNDFIPSYTLVAFSQKNLIAEKIQALLSRQKPRDFYDLYFILRANLLPTEERHILSKVLETLQSAKINFEQELKQFLPKSHWAIIRDFKATLEREIGRFS